jgi:hypothetical protein
MILRIDMNTMDETAITTNIKVKRTRNRPCKSDRFKEEREQLLMKLEELISLDEEVRGVLLYDLERNEKLKEYLMDNLDLIKRLYKYGSWNYFIMPEERRNPIGLLRSIFKTEFYEIITRLKYTERNGIKKKYTQIFFIRNIKANK